MRLALTIALITLAACGDETTSEPDADATATDAAEPEPDTVGDTTTNTTTADTTPDVVSGLDERPPASTCVAFPRPSTSASGDVALEPAFPNMDFDGTAIGLRRARIAPDAPLRWFVLDRAGLIWTFIDAHASKTGLNAEGQPVEQAQVFLDLPVDVSTDGEGGLLGFDLEPGFGQDPDANWVYVHYTTYPENNVWAFRVVWNGSAWGAAQSQLVFHTAAGGSNHWGGDLKFGPDGYLYVTLGDGGNGMSPEDAGKTTWLRGKILRIDPRDHSDSQAYTIPESNPFYGNPGCSGRDLTDNATDCPEIFAYGFRNPWRLSFDRANGDLWVGDVGAGKEEVNLVEPGLDYGWNTCDGRDGDGCPPANAAATRIAPVAQYRDVTAQASVTGGYVYRGAALGSALLGAYLFSDVYTGELMVIDHPYANVEQSPFRVSSVFEHPAQEDEQDLPRFRVLTTGLETPVSFAEDEDAELYVVTFGDGPGRAIYKLVPASGVISDTVPATLSATGCVDPSDPTKPAAGMIPYELNAPFWSDGADKSRWIALPANAQIGIGSNAEADWDMPIGTVVMKAFRLQGKLIETRLMVRHDDGGWAGYSYVWRADQSDADATAIDGESRVYGDQTWSYPSRSGCMNCHAAQAGGTLGLETRQLNRAHHYAETGRDANQVDTFAHIGLFSNPPTIAADSLPAFVDPFGSAPLADRARTYLHANCAQCHRAGREPDLKFTTPLIGSGLCNDIRVVPGDGAGSRLVTIMRESNATLRMPKGAGTVLDEAGIGLIQAWIDSLTSCP